MKWWPTAYHRHMAAAKFCYYMYNQFSMVLIT